MKLAQGAEAIITREGDKVIKNRTSKSYRHQALDIKLREQRTRHEARILEKLLKEGVLVPKVLKKEKFQLTLSFIDSPKLRDVLHLHPLKYGRELGRIIAKIHSLNIVHGDLTTSNILAGKSLTLIDFGLSFTSHKVEDKAVDLHVVREALESTHPSLFKKVFFAVISEYKTYENASNVLKRLEIVESRGRNKGSK